MPRRLPGENPVRCDTAVVTQCIVATAEILAAEIRCRLAVQRMLAVVDRSGIDARVLQEREDERLARRDVIRQLGRAEISSAVGANDRSRRRRREGGIDAIVHAIICAEKPELVAEDETADVEAIVVASEPLRRSRGGDDLFRVALP